MKQESKKRTSGIHLEKGSLPIQNCRQGKGVNTHFALSIVAVCLSCFTGFFAIPLALAGLILSLRTQDQLTQGRTEEAAKTAFWAGLFGWITVLTVLIPVILFVFFGGVIITGLAALISAL